MADLDTLRPEVREAIHDIAIAARLRPEYQQSVGIIRAELLRLARENDEWQMRCLQFQTERDHARQMHADRDVDVQHEWARAEAAEAELAALKAKIANAQIGTVVLDERETQIISCDLPEGTRVALVKVEE